MINDFDDFSCGLMEQKRAGTSIAPALSDQLSQLFTFASPYE